MKEIRVIEEMIEKEIPKKTWGTFEVEEDVCCGHVVGHHFPRNGDLIAQEAIKKLRKVSSEANLPILEELAEQLRLYIDALETHTMKVEAEVAEAYSDEIDAEYDDEYDDDEY